MATLTKTSTPGPATLARRVKAARDMYPSAQIRVRRGRVVAVQGDVIHLISFKGKKL